MHRGTMDHRDPATAMPVERLGWTRVAAGPTTGVACSGARDGLTSPALHAATPRRSGNRLRRGACTLWESLLSTVGRRCFANLHWLGHGINRQIVVRDFCDLVPVQPRGIANRLLQARLTPTVRDDIEPVTVRSILGSSAL